MKKIAFAAALTALAVSAMAQPYYGTWNRFRTLTLNTSATGGGANVQGAVANFPLLVRLTSASVATGANILAEALPNGADIRFTDSTGAIPLAYQIDSWSSTSAAAWVKVPGVAANGTTKVRIWWNRTGAADSSRAASVFDTAAGFTGVWHLDQDVTGAAGVLDATGNALNFNGHPSVPAVPGMIGRARHYNASEENSNFWVDNFTGASNEAKAEKFRANGIATRLTISTWVNPQVQSSQDIQGIFGHYRYGSNNRSYMLAMGNNGTLRVNTSTAGTGDRVVESASTPLDSLGKWRHVMMTIDSGAANTQIKVYVDGRRIAMPDHPTQAIFRASTTADNARPMIGAMELSYNHRFQGYIDELQFSNGVARDSNWARLSYETQKAAPTAVTLGATESPVARALFYPLKSANYKRNVAILANDPVVQGTATGYVLTNLAGSAATLPTGLTFSTTTGQIAGTPTVVTASAQYVVQVNLQGGGTGRDTLSIGVVPGDVPGAPGTPTAVLGPLNSGIDTVKWTAPSSVGSSPITGYKAMAVQDTSKSCTTTGLSCAVPGLSPTTAYSFQVRALNGEGAGPLSAVSNLLTPPTIPGAPASILGVAGTGIGTIDVYWNAPSNGGMPITQYKVLTVQDTAKSCVTTGALTCRVAGLTGGAAYSFQVRAVNAVGPGPLSLASPTVTAPSTSSILPGSFVVRVSGSSKPFTFVLPASAVSATDAMTMVVSDVWGRAVWSKTVVPSRHGRELTWNGKASNGRAVSAGMYVVRVSLLGAGRKVELAGKTVSIKP
jgi:hypothetical protein